MFSGLFKDKPILNKFFIVIGVVLLVTGVLTIGTAFLCKILYGVDMMSSPDILSQTDDPAVLSSLKLIQTIGTGIGMFVIPGFILGYLFSNDTFGYLNLRKGVSGFQVVLILTLLIVAVPLVNFLIAFNENMQLPQFLSSLEEWMRQSEAAAQDLTVAFLDMHSVTDLLFNLFMMAVLPALGEELIFRGIIQRLFKELTGNIHIAIILAAIIFSAFHMQFYGFIPRMLLGVLFGYLLYWTGSLWLPIIAHFVNNALAVTLAWLNRDMALPFDQDTIGTGEGEWKLVVVSLILTSMIIVMIRRSTLLNSMQSDENV